MKTTSMVLLCTVLAAACGGGGDECDAGVPVFVNQQAAYHAQCDPKPPEPAASAASAPAG